jgi:hypothetical protein
MSEAKISTKKTEDKRLFQIGIGFVLFIESILIWLLSSNFTLPVTTRYLESNSGNSFLGHVTKELFRVQVAHILIIFLLVPSILHLIIAIPSVYAKYRKFIENKINPIRWLEYSITAPLMIILVAMLTGIFDLSTLILLFTAGVSMLLFGANMEYANKNMGNVKWANFIYGSIIGIIPWIIIWMHIAGARDISLIPMYTIIAFFSLLAFFAFFPLNMFLYYMKVGPWKDYEFVETCFVMLSLCSKSALAWQVFIGLMG